MLPLGNLLDRFKNLKNTEKAKKERIVDIFTKNSIPVKINQISIVKNTLFIKVQPIIKSEILLKKEEFLIQIKKIPGLENILQIQ